jgi:hypothetical protein
VLKAYFDESAKQASDGKDACVVIGGYIAMRQDWECFVRDWQRVLNKYRVDVFHFHEYHAKASYKDPDSDYYQWNNERRDSFFYDLAMVMSKRVVPVGGDYPIDQHREKGLDSDPLSNVFAAFFNDVREAVTAHWPKCAGKDNSDRILFVYDGGDNKSQTKWTEPLIRVHRFFKERDTRFGDLLFEDDKVCQPLQAADFYCGVYRQAAERRQSTGMLQGWRIIDIILSRHLRQPGHQWSYSDIPDGAFKRMVESFLEDEKRQKRQWKRAGIHRKYFPLKHHPLAAQFNSGPLE